MSAIAFTMIAAPADSADGQNPALADLEHAHVREVYSFLLVSSFRSAVLYFCWRYILIETSYATSVSFGVLQNLG